MSISADSAPARAARVCNVLLTLGFGQVSDSFLIPASSVLSSGVFYASESAVQCASGSERFFVRVADLPFEILPRDLIRAHQHTRVFSLGPGLLRSGGQSPLVLLLYAHDREGNLHRVIEQLTETLSFAEDPKFSITDCLRANLPDEKVLHFAAGIVGVRPTHI